MQSVLEGIGALAEIQRDAGQESVANGISELTKPFEVVPRHPCSRLDFEGHHTSVVPLDNKVDFVSVVRPPVPDPGDAVEPRGLFDDLEDRERLEEMAELTQGDRVQ